MSDEKVRGWRLGVVWLLLFAISWVVFGLIARVLCHLFMLGWRLVP